MNADRPVASSMMGLPELPPSESVRYCITWPLEPALGPVEVCWVWLAAPLSTPYPVMRIVGGLRSAMMLKKSPWAASGVCPVVEFANALKTPQSLPTAPATNVMVATSIAY